MNKLCAFFLAVALILSSAHAQLSEDGIVLNGTLWIGPASTLTGANTYTGLNLVDESNTLKVSNALNFADTVLGALSGTDLSGFSASYGLVKFGASNGLIGFEPGSFGFVSSTLNLTDITIVYGAASLDLSASLGQLSGYLDLNSVNCFILGSSVFSSLNNSGFFIDDGSYSSTLSISEFSSLYDSASGVLSIVESSSVIPEPASSGLFVTFFIGFAFLFFRKRGR
jgi:hypothetical protein